MVDLHWPPCLPLGNRLNPSKEHCSIQQPTTTFSFLSFLHMPEQIEAQDFQNQIPLPSPNSFFGVDITTQTHFSEHSGTWCNSYVQGRNANWRQVELFKEHRSNQCENISRCTSRNNDYLLLITMIAFHISCSVLKS